MRQASIMLSGFFFAAGLIVAGMTQPSKVVGFLDITGAWDPSLGLVMVGAILVHALTRPFVMNRGAPEFAKSFHVPTRNDLDAKLVLGAALFGVGWGLAGYCPGPALVASSTFAPSTLVFVLALLSTIAVFDTVMGRLASGRSPPTSIQSRASSEILGRPRP